MIGIDLPMRRILVVLFLFIFWVQRGYAGALPTITKVERQFVLLSTMPEVKGVNLFISGVTAFESGNPIRIIDFSDPELPQIIGSFPTDEQIIAVSDFGTLVYLETQILDTTDPTNPTVLSTIPNGLRLSHVDEPMGYAITHNSDDDSTLHFISVEDTSNPKVIATHEDLPGKLLGSSTRISSVAAEDSLLFVMRTIVFRSYGHTQASSRGSLFDISNPKSPILISQQAFYETGSATYRATSILGDCLIITTGNGGCFNQNAIGTDIRNRNDLSDSVYRFAENLARRVDNRTYISCSFASSHGIDDSRIQILELIENDRFLLIQSQGLGSIQGITGIDDLVFVSRRKDGLEIYREVIPTPTPGPTMANPRSDIDGSLEVNAEDLLILLKDWKKSTSASN